MSIRYWIIAVTLGLTVSINAPKAWGQIATEEQPRQEESAAASNESGDQDQTNAIELAPALEGIESAIRELITEEDTIAREEGEKREKRDLAAQEGMALWAEWMFYTTAATVILTFFALVAIIRTLHHTRRAADSAEEMALDTRTIGKAQVRAYLHCRYAEYNIDNDSVEAVLEFENTGQSPARNVEVIGSVTINEIGGREDHPRVMAWLSAKISRGVSEPVAAQSTAKGRISFFWDFDFPEDDLFDRKTQKTIFEDGNQVWFDLEVSWADVFGDRHEIALNLIGDPGPSPYAPEKTKRTSVGELEIITDENTLTRFRNQSENDQG